MLVHLFDLLSSAQHFVVVLCHTNGFQMIVEASSLADGQKLLRQHPGSMYVFLSTQGVLV